MTLVTEEQAKRMECPALAVFVGLCMVAQASGEKIEVDRPGQSLSRCLASKCMWWRWAEKFQDSHTGEPAREGTYEPGRLAELGFCGLAGKP